MTPAARVRDGSIRPLYGTFGTIAAWDAGVKLTSPHVVSEEDRATVLPGEAFHEVKLLALYNACVSSGESARAPFGPRPISLMKRAQAKVPGEAADSVMTGSGCDENPSK